MTSDLVAERFEIHSVKQILARPEEQRTHRKMQFVHETRGHVLPDDADAAENSNVAVPCGLACAFQRTMDPAGLEMELGTTIHGQRTALMMCKDEHR